LDDCFPAHLSPAELPPVPQFACVVGDLDHMQVSFKQSNWTPLLIKSLFLS